MASLYTLSLSHSPDEIRYVGITKHDDVLVRLKAHKWKARSGNSVRLYNWIRKHYEDVVITKVEGDLSWEEACTKERQLISELRASNAKLLNLTDGGEGHLGLRPSTETRKRMSKAQTGRVVSEETKKKISLSNSGKKRTIDARKKMSDAKRGRKLTEEHKVNIGKSGIGRMFSSETRKKMSEVQKGKTLSTSHIEKLRAGQKRRRAREKQEKRGND